MGKTDKKYTLEGQFELFMKRLKDVPEQDKKGIRQCFFASFIHMWMFFEREVSKLDGDEASKVMDGILNEGHEFLREMEGGSDGEGGF